MWGKDNSIECMGIRLHIDARLVCGYESPAVDSDWVWGVVYQVNTAVVMDEDTVDMYILGGTYCIS